MFCGRPAEMGVIIVVSLGDGEEFDNLARVHHRPLAGCALSLEMGKGFRPAIGRARQHDSLVTGDVIPEVIADDRREPSLAIRWM